MIEGQIQTFPLPDLIQWVALTRRTGELSIAQGPYRAEVHFAAGEIAGAASPETTARVSQELVRAVLASTLAWRWGSFIFKECSLRADIAAADMRMAVDGLLLEIMSQLGQSQNPEAGLGPDKWAEEQDCYSDTFTLADRLRLRVADQLLKEDFQVPPMPHLASRVLELTSKEDFSLRDLGNLILTDQSVAAQILRYANSAHSGSQRRVETLPQAVQRLGTDEVVNIVLALMVQARRPGRDIFAAERHRLWVQSSTSALFARSLANLAGLDRNVGFLCGLLMDFGINILYSLIQGALGSGSGSALSCMPVVVEIVRDYHSRVGQVVGEKWRLPRPVIESMAHHHCLEGATSYRPYVAVTALAGVLATFALSKPRAELEESLSHIQPQRLASHPAAQVIELGPGIAELLLEDLPRQLDHALELVVK